MGIRLTDNQNYRKGNDMITRTLLAFAASMLLLLSCSEGTERDKKQDKICFEDEPCWDCHTMGNRICGPDIP